MQVHRVFLALAISFIVSTESRPLFTDFVLSNYEYPTTEITAEPQYLQYQEAYPPYYVYNVPTNVKAIPTAVLANGKPAISHVPTYNFYYGTPVYDLRFPLNPVYPVLRPSHPGLLPKPTAPPTTTPKPDNSDEDDGIEKLDIKQEPETEMKKPEENIETEDDDSVAVEAI